MGPKIVLRGEDWPGATASLWNPLSIKEQTLYYILFLKKKKKDAKKNRENALDETHAIHTHKDNFLVEPSLIRDLYATTLPLVRNNGCK